MPRDKSMRGPKFKLIHKPTGLTFKQKAKKVGGGIDGYYDEPGYHLIPILLDSGQPAFYIDTNYYPSMTILSLEEWDVIIKEKPCTT
jgi:hypothetical protein